MGRRFYIVWFGQLLSTIGSDLTAFGVAFWVFAETGSTTWLAVMFGANAVPRIAITPLLGLVDRVDRRTIMLATDTGAALATMAIIAVWAIGDLRPWHLLVASLVGSTFAAVQRPAYSAALPSLVEPEVLDRANGLDQLGPGIGAIVAPGLAGALVAWVGVGAVFAIDLATFAIGMVSVAAVRFGGLAEPQPGERFGLWAAVAWLRSEGRPLGVLTVVMAATNVALSITMVAIVARAEELAGDAAVGLGPTAGGVGMVVVSLVVGARGIPRRRRMGAVGLSVIGFGVLLALAVAARSLALFAICVGLGISTLPFLTAIVRTVFQQWVPDRLLGRVFGVTGALTTVAEPVGLALAIPLVAWSIAGSLVVAGAAVAVLGVVVALLPALRPLDEPPG